MANALVRYPPSLAFEGKVASVIKETGRDQGKWRRWFEDVLVPPRGGEMRRGREGQLGTQVFRVYVLCADDPSMRIPIIW